MLNLKYILCFFILAIVAALAGNAFAADGNTTSTTVWAVNTTEDVSTTQVNTSTSTTVSSTTSLTARIPSSTTTKSATSTTNGGGGASKTANTAVSLRTTTTIQQVTISTSGVAAGLSTQFVSTTTEPDMTISEGLSTDSTYVPTTLAVFLVVEIISPRPGASVDNVQEIRLRVSYSNDGLIPDQYLNVLAGTQKVSLTRIGDFFIGRYSPPSNLSDLNISVSDRSGYSGKADVLLVPSKNLVDDRAVRAAGSFGLVAVGIFVVFVVPLLLVRRFRGSKGDRSIEKGQYSEVKKMIDSMNKESEDVNLSKWVFDKLSHGEDPEVLKKGLSEMGYDPKIVDKVLDSQ